MNRTSRRSIARRLWGIFLFGSIQVRLLFLAGTLVALTLLGAAVALFGLGLPLGDALWWTWTHMLDPGFLGVDNETWRQKALGTLFALAGMVILGGGLFAIAGEAASKAFDQLLKGRIPSDMKSHTVIAGVGPKVKTFIESLENLSDLPSADEIVVVVPDASAIESTRKCCKNKALVTVNEIWKPEEQERLNLHRAKRLLILENFGGDSGDMLGAIVKLVDKRVKGGQDEGKPEGELKAYAELNDRSLLSASQIFVRAVRDPGAKMEINLMNMADASARVALQQHPLDCIPMDGEPNGKVLLFIAGWSPFADALFQQALRLAHYPVKPTRIIVATPKAADLKSQILAAAPGLEDQQYVSQIISVDFSTTLSPADWGIQKEDMVTLAFCGDNPDETFARSIHFSEVPFQGLQQIYLELPDGSGYWDVLNSQAFKNRNIKILPVGSHAQAFELAEKRNQQAKESHAKYLREREEQGLRLPDGKGGYLDENDYDWEELDEMRRGWNRTPIDHAGIKLRALADFHGIARPAADAESIDPYLSSRIAEMTIHVSDKRHLPDLEFLSRIEHDRWSGEKIAEGWRRAETKDATRKLSPYLVPYDSLSEEVKKYDREQVVEQLNQILKQA